MSVIPACGGFGGGDLELKAAWAMAFQFPSYCERMWLGSHLWSRMSSGPMPRNAITNSYCKFIFSLLRVSTLICKVVGPVWDFTSNEWGFTFPCILSSIVVYCSVDLRQIGWGIWSLKLFWFTFPQLTGTMLIFWDISQPLFLPTFENSLFRSQTHFLNEYFDFAFVGGFLLSLFFEFFIYSWH